MRTKKLSVTAGTDPLLQLVIITDDGRAFAMQFDMFDALFEAETDTESDMLAAFRKRVSPPVEDFLGMRMRQEPDGGMVIEKLKP